MNISDITRMKGEGIDMIVLPFVFLSPLAEKVLRLGLCPRCHKHTLWLIEADQFYSYQCELCTKVFVLEEKIDENLLVSRG